MKRVRSILLLGGLIGTGVAAGGTPTQPDRKECNLEFTGVRVGGDVTTRFQSRETYTGRHNTWVGGGVDARCVNTDQRIRSDSAEHFEDEKRLFLIGRVHYTEKRLTLDADRIIYLTGEERLIAEGNVVGVTNTGTRFRGVRAEYWRAAPGLRDRSRLEAGQRPDLWLSPADAGGKSRDSTHILADSVTVDNDSLVYGRGNTVVERSDLTATADSAFLDQGREIAQLRKSPRVVGRGDRRFTLSGEIIDVLSRNREVERVRSAGRARATSDDVELMADSIELHVAEQKLVRAVAWGPIRARATQPGREITSDSIDVVMPGQRLREIHAVRGARAESLPDSTKIVPREKDWLSGDTIVAAFDTTVAPDSAAKAAITRLVATGHARSWQQLQHAGATGRDSTPAISYVTGGEILVRFDRERQVEYIDVKDKVWGVYLQPESDSARAKALRDSLATRKAPPRPPGRRP